MRRFQILSSVLLLVALGVTAVPVPASPPDGLAPRTARVGGVHLASPRSIARADTSLTCFTGPLSLLLNPGCFSPPGSGDCVAHASQYFVQYITPSFTTPHRIKGFGFISNDGATVFPAAGVLLIPHADNRFPRPGELDSLPVRNVVTPHDTAIVVVDLRAYDLRVGSSTDVVVCLRFPEGGQLVAVGTGPGILVDEVTPDPSCDYFTVDGGARYSSNAVNDPLDWGFELIFEPVTPVESTSWSDLKRLYGTERRLLYQSP